MNARFPTSFHDAPGRTELPALSSPALTQSAHKDFLLSAECLSHLAHLSLRYTSLRIAMYNPSLLGLFEINQIFSSTSTSSTPPFSSVVALVAVTETSLTATALTMVEVLLFLILM